MFLTKRGPYASSILQDSLRSIKDELRKVDPIGDEGRVVASIRAMDDAKASEIADDVFSLWERLDGLTSKDESGQP